LDKVILVQNITKTSQNLLSLHTLDINLITYYVLYSGGEVAPSLGGGRKKISRGKISE